ncbi:hypothetical protein CLAIMM_06727 [Cladophialophora immunda]|nr:hypothetical protein CLAIMM_06727 [Cladophialophora immunda]
MIPRFTHIWRCMVFQRRSTAVLTDDVGHLCFILCTLSPNLGRNNNIRHLTWKEGGRVVSRSSFSPIQTISTYHDNFPL